MNNNNKRKTILLSIEQTNRTTNKKKGTAKRNPVRTVFGSWCFVCVPRTLRKISIISLVSHNISFVNIKLLYLYGAVFLILT